MTTASRILRSTQSFVTGGSFPAFGLVLLASWQVFLIGMLFVPASSSSLGAFAEDFRVWCFGYDPATGRTEWAYVMSMLLPPSMIALFILLLWWEPLREMLRRPAVFLAHALAAILLVVGSAAGLVLTASEPTTGELPFPAEALRTAYTPPALSLTNQVGEAVDLEAMKGNVILLTAVYASCGHSCPVILQQTKASIAELDPASVEGLRVVAVTMDPENDSEQVLRMLAENHGMQAPLYNLVTGEPARVEGILDRMQIARTRDPETGVIDHANLFLLIDREGKLAYRLGIGERQQRWLTSALRVLLREEKVAS